MISKQISGTPVIINSLQLKAPLQFNERLQVTQVSKEQDTSILWSLIPVPNSKNILIENFEQGGYLNGRTFELSFKKENPDIYWRISSINKESTIHVFKNVNMDAYLKVGKLKNDLECEIEVMEKMETHWEIEPCKLETKFEDWKMFLTTIKKETPCEDFNTLVSILQNSKATPSDISKLNYTDFKNWVKIISMGSLERLYFYFLIEIGKIRKNLICHRGLIIKNLMNHDKVLKSTLINVPYGYCVDIRHVKTCNSLHYQDPKQLNSQVYCSTYKLNKDDLWAVVPACKKNKSTFINFGDRVSLVHFNTHSFLTTHRRHFSSTSKHQKVSCIHKSKVDLFSESIESKDWIIIGDSYGQPIKFGDKVNFVHCVTGMKLFSDSCFEGNQDVTCGEGQKLESEWIFEFHIQ
jgi:hypothetical protein